MTPGGAILLRYASFDFDIDSSTCDPFAAPLDVVACSEISGNLSTAVSVLGSAGRIVRTLFRDNQRDPLAALPTAIYVNKEVNTDSTLDLENCLLYDNGTVVNPGAVVRAYAGSDVFIRSSTFANNNGRPAQWGANSNGLFEQSIAQFNLVPELNLEANSTVDLVCSNYQGHLGTPASTVQMQNVQANLFGGQMNDDYSLIPASPSLNVCSDVAYISARPDLVDKPALGWFDQGALERQ